MDTHTAGAQQGGGDSGYLSISEAAAGLAPVGAETSPRPRDETENATDRDPAQAEAVEREAPAQQREAQDEGDRQEPEANEEREEAEGPEDDKEEAEAEAAAGDDLDPDTEIEVTMPGGEKAAVTLSELVKGYSREADYSRKTAEVAAEKRQLQDWARGAQQRVDQEVAKRLAFLDDLGAFQMPEQPNPELARDDPDAWIEQQAQYTAAMDRIAKAQQAREDVQGRQQQQQQARLAEENKLLASKWTDLTQDAWNAMVSDTIDAYGFSQEEMNLLTDHRLALALRDAQRYRSMVSKAGKAKPAPKPVRRVQRPGPSTTQADRARDTQGRFASDLTRATSVADQIDIAARHLKPLG